MSGYEPRAIEQKWQAVWAGERTWEVPNPGEPGFDEDKPKAYVCEMLPYPSGEPHVGHLKCYAVGDAIAHFRRRQGFQVVHPMGYDAFGLPAENNAIKTGEPPRVATERSIESFRRQFQEWGISIDWSREIATHKPDYYRWTQWIFLQLFEKGLAYRTEAAVQWCPKDATVLANEQVVDGRCERCGTEVIQKSLEQWFFKITDYADRLLEDFDRLESWPEHVITMQRNWIGRSEGAEVAFRNTKWASISPSSPPVPTPSSARRSSSWRPSTRNWRSWSRGRGRGGGARVRGQSRARVGRGTRGGGPGEDRGAARADGRQSGQRRGDSDVRRRLRADGVRNRRDHGGPRARFPRLRLRPGFGLPVKRVIEGSDPEAPGDAEGLPYSGDGPMVNSGRFDGQGNRDAYAAMIEWLKEEGRGETAVNYRLRDWLLSRQRYWGAPIPIVYCDECGMVPVPDDQLPVELPEIEDYAPHGQSPLAAATDWVQTTCPKCGGAARRETDTMDTFVDSSWYYIRYLDPRNSEAAWDRDAAAHWMPVDQYIGGVEHAILHLMYARFVTKALADLGHLEVQEPFANLFAQGMITRDGAKMSKSRGNTVSPAEYVERYGADTSRTYVCFMGPPERGGDWTDEGVEGVNRFLSRLWRLCEEVVERTAGGSERAGRRGRARRRRWRRPRARRQGPLVDRQGDQGLRTRLPVQHRDLRGDGARQRRLPAEGRPLRRSRRGGGVALRHRDGGLADLPLRAAPGQRGLRPDHRRAGLGAGLAGRR